jgi:hypothetical protein
MLKFGYRILNDEINRVPLSFKNELYQTLNGSFIVGAKTINIVINVTDLINLNYDRVIFSASEVMPIYQKSGGWFPMEYKGILLKTGFKNKVKLTGVLTLKSVEYTITVDLFDSSDRFGHLVVPMILKRNQKPRQVLTASAA